MNTLYPLQNRFVMTNRPVRNQDCLLSQALSFKENLNNSSEVLVQATFPRPFLLFKGADDKVLGPEEKSFLEAAQNINKADHIVNILANVINASSKSASYFFSLKDKTGKTAFHTVIERTKNNWTIAEFLQLLKKYRSIDFNIQDKEGFTPFALSCKLWNQEFIKHLMVDKSIDRTIQDHQGKTALNHLIQLYPKSLSHEKKYLLEFISKFFQETPSPRILGKMNPTGYEGVIQLNYLPLIKLVMENHLKAWQNQHENDVMFDSKTTLAPKNQDFEIFIYHLLQEAIVNNGQKTMEVVLDAYQPTLEHQDALLLTAMMHGKKETVDFLQGHHRFQSDHLVEAWRDWESHLVDDRELYKSSKLLDLMPHIFTHEKNSVLEIAIKTLLGRIKTKDLGITSHPNESELMLLLNHSTEENRSSIIRANLVTALQSVSDFEKTETLSTPQMIENWATIGRVAHSFHRWQLESYGASSSLMAQYHQEPVLFRNSDAMFGEGFLYRDPNGQFLIEFRESYIAITQENQGTLLIRNSDNPKYRQLLIHPAYFLEKSLTESQLLNLNPLHIPENQHILHRRLYHRLEAPEKIKTLLGHLTAVQEAYGRFKLNTVKPKPNQSTLLHLSESEGLKSILKILKQLQSQGSPLPDLAFINPNLPIAHPYPFYLFNKSSENQGLTDENHFNEALVNSVQQQFQVSPRHLDALEQILSGAAYSPDYAKEVEEWIQFVEQAGFQKKGELIFISPYEKGRELRQIEISKD